MGEKYLSFVDKSSVLVKDVSKGISQHNNMKREIFGIILGLGLAASAYADVYEIGLNTLTPSDWLLKGSYEVPANASTATGGPVGGGLSYDNATESLSVNIIYGKFGFQPLQGSFTSGGLYSGNSSSTGPLLADLTPLHFAFSSKAGYFEGTVHVDRAMENQLWTSDLYININSTLFPVGEIRAQLVPVTIPEPTSWMLFAGGFAALLMFRKRH